MNNKSLIRPHQESQHLSQETTSKPWNSSIHKILASKSKDQQHTILVYHKLNLRVNSYQMMSSLRTLICITLRHNNASCPINITQSDASSTMKLKRIEEDLWETTRVRSVNMWSVVLTTMSVQWETAAQDLTIEWKNFTTQRNTK